MRLAAPFGAEREIEFAWPEVLTDRDPYAGDEALDDPLPGEDDARFRSAYRAALDGRGTFAAVRAAAEAVGVGGPVRHDRRRPWPGSAVVSDAEIVDLAENWVPDLGLLAPDRVLGPWADEPLKPELRLLAGAVMAFAPIMAPRSRPVGRAMRSRPRPTVGVRSGMKSALRAPVMLWERRGDRLAPLLPLPAAWVPDGPVAGLPRTPAVICRAALGPDGWWAACALPLPAPPPGRVIRARLLAEYWRWRRHEPRLTWEDLLRDRGEVGYRAVCEWMWTVLPEPCFQLWCSASLPLERAAPSPAS